MSRKRVVCYGSDVYHKPNCHYVKRMRPAMRLTVTKADAIKHDCRICKYCNSIHYHLNTEQECMEYYGRRGMEFVTINGALFVKTRISCWKLVYTKGNEGFILFHINFLPENFDFTHPQTCRYHRQDDVPTCGSIAGYLRYIYEHDTYKESVRSGSVITDFGSKRGRLLAAKSEKKRARRSLDCLFVLIENQNPEYKKLSFC